MAFASDEVPQANRADLILGLVVDIANETYNIELICASLERRGNTHFVDRQGSYYVQAAICLGLVVQDAGGYVLTRRGLAIAAINYESEQESAFASAILESPLFLAIQRDLDLNFENPETVRHIESWLYSNTNLAKSTAKRRASAVHQLLLYGLEKS